MGVFILERGGFDLPLCMTSGHLIMKLILSIALVRYFSVELPTLSTRRYWLTVVPIGLFTSFDIAATNLAVVTGSVTLTTIIKTAFGLLSQLLWSVVMGLQQISARLIVVVAWITTGSTLVVSGTSDAVAIAFLASTVIYCMLAAQFGAGRWTITEFLLRGDELSGQELRDKPKIHKTFALLRLISPPAALTMVPVALIGEGGEIPTSRFLRDPSPLLEMVVIGIIGGSLACVLILVEIRLVQKTDAFTVNVISIFGKIIQTLLSIFIFHDAINLMRVTGILISFAGIFAFTVEKARLHRLWEEHGYEYSGITPHAHSDKERAPVWAPAEEDGSDRLTLGYILFPPFSAALSTARALMGYASGSPYSSANSPMSRASNGGSGGSSDQASYQLVQLNNHDLGQDLDDENDFGVAVEDEHDYGDLDNLDLDDEEKYIEEEFEELKGGFTI